MLKKWSDLLPKIIFLTGVISLLFAFLKALSIDQFSYTGFEIVFGKEIIDFNPFDLGTIASAHLPFSLIAFLHMFYLL